jgi:hypothetical protein
MPKAPDAAGQASDWHAIPAKDAMRRQGADRDSGLSDDEAEARRQSFGSNRLTEKSPRSEIRIGLKIGIGRKFRQNFGRLIGRLSAGGCI